MYQKHYSKSVNVPNTTEKYRKQQKSTKDTTVTVPKTLLQLTKKQQKSTENITVSL